MACAGDQALKIKWDRWCCYYSLAEPPFLLSRATRKIGAPSAIWGTAAFSYPERQPQRRHASSAHQPSAHSAAKTVAAPPCLGQHCVYGIVASKAPPAHADARKLGNANIGDRTLSASGHNVRFLDSFRSYRHGFWPREGAVMLRPAGGALHCSMQ
ncbi:hypothetical protein GGTG_14020 [Gaeumannomyces tritici R3-111a-1]|uniref:Uncharacterized protein n=1 Tax=Gaeumannomyces tritici (strain R3-111a-1) TaxID=644352 RepID=J3PKG4_GAET3|nr:hypothetical protein GGTG_14020 [Gaeumannomyces tritici R3-111a-1]EJT68401.1 hypothetical protein GGTG_14020 [Gaeumannomyces tritici R3-111a-1]